MRFGRCIRGKCFFLSLSLSLGTGIDFRFVRPVETDMGKNAIEYYAHRGNIYPLKWNSVEESAASIQKVVCLRTGRSSPPQFFF